MYKTILKYHKVKGNPALKITWNTAFGKESGNMMQGDKRTGGKRKKIHFVMLHNEIRSILKDWVVTYASIVVDHRPRNEDPNPVRITVCGNLIKYTG